jgi:anaerobic magnesium-protoporphyrin IX monomethyl ester cyclase
MKQIVFLYPDYTERIGNKFRTEMPPLGMLYVCAVAEEEGLEVKVIPVTLDTAPEAIPRADIYAYSITATAVYPIFMRLVPLIKRKAKLHIAGNTHANIFPNQVLDELGLDVVFKGEGEIAFREWFRDGCQQNGIIHGKQADINEIPFPARHLLPTDRVLMNRRIGGRLNNVVTIYSSRGCVYNCAYCGNLNNGSSRLRTPENFRRELSRIKELYPQVEGITVMDEMFTFNPQHAIAIAHTINKATLPWECTTRADFLRHDVVRALVDTDCREVKLGMESGSQFMLDKMNKKLDLGKARKSILRAGQMGLPIKLFIMHGFPGENHETTKETIDFIRELQEVLHRVVLYRFTPIPGSPVYSSNEVIHHDWNDYTIYQNSQKWWGNDMEFQVVNESFDYLRDEVISMFGSVN